MGERSRRVLRGIRSPLDSGSIIGRTSPGRGPAEQLSVAEVLGFIGSVGDVTLAGSFDYLTLSGQEITLNAIDLDTDISGTLAIASGGTGAQNATDARTNLGLGSAAVEDIGTSGANIGLLSTNVTHSGSFSVTGAFRSIGIDDNATVEVFELEDDNAMLGGSGITDFTFLRNINSKLLGLSGGNSSTNGFNFLLHGGTHATLANDLLGRSGSTTIFEWNDSASLFSFLSGNVLVANDLSVAGAFTSLGINDDASGERLKVVDGALVIGPSSGSYAIRQAIDTESFTLSGGSANNAGANIIMFAGTHPTRANDLLYRASSTVILSYDHSITRWLFDNSSVLMTGALTVQGVFASVGINDTTTGSRMTITDGQLRMGASGQYNMVHFNNDQSFLFSGGSGGADGANILLNGGIISGVANDIRIRANTITHLYYDHSATLWNFQNSNVTCDQALTVGAPTGGVKGTGDINAQAVYDDNVLLTCYPLEAHLDGSIDLKAWDSRVLNREHPSTKKTVIRKGKEVDIPDKAAYTEERTHGPAKKFAARAERDLDPKLFWDDMVARKALPAMPTQEEWAKDGPLSTGDIIQRLWETVEVMAIHGHKQQLEINELKRGKS